MLYLEEIDDVFHSPAMFDFLFFCPTEVHGVCKEILIHQHVPGGHEVVEVERPVYNSMFRKVLAKPSFAEFVGACGDLAPIVVYLSLLRQRSR